MNQLTKFILITVTLTHFGFLVENVKAQSDYITTVESTPNLLGYWRFSPASQANSEVNGYTGMFVGNAMVGPAGSGPMLAVDPNNSAAIFAGTGDFVLTTLQGQIDQEGTVIAWFYLTELPATMNDAFFIAGESETNNYFNLIVVGDGSVRFFATTDAQGSATVGTVDQLNTWYMAVGSFNIAHNQTSVLLAKLGDNAFSSGGTNAPEHHLNTVPFTIGGTSSASTFKGRIDEVAIYNRELSLEELTAILTSTKVPGTSLSLTGALSRKTHSAAGDFDLPLTLDPTTNATVEPRSGGPTQVIFTFSGNIVASDGIISANEFVITNATFNSASILGNELTLNLTDVIDQSVVTIALSGIEDTSGNPLGGDSDVAIRALLADVNQDQVVDRSDLPLVGHHLRETANSSNFLSDLDLDGLVRRLDAYLIIHNRHHAVP